MCLVLPDHFRNQVEDKLNQSCLKFKIYKEKYFIHIRYSTSQKKNCQEEKQPEKQDYYKINPDSEDNSVL